MGHKLSVYFWKHLYMIIGFAVIAMGIDVQRVARVGLPSYGVLQRGIEIQTPLTFGQASMVVSFICIVLSAWLGVKPRLATVLNMIFIGFFIDWFYPAVDALALVMPLWERILVFFLGTAQVAWGIAMYISANLGSGPRDSLMIALVQRTRKRVGVVVTCIEGTVLTLGYLLGGPVGLGTVISMVSMGWLVETGLSFFRRCSKLGPLARVIEVSIGHQAAGEQKGG